jgi:nucleoside-diphosphate-sugar epimerase
MLIVGCGDVALRFARIYPARFRAYGLIRNPEQAEKLRQAGITPVIADLDDPRSLVRLAGLGEWIVHLAPPRQDGETDARTARLLAVLARGQILPRRITYVSTSGVYGDCAGEWVSEARPPRPNNVRAKRRLDAERRLRAFSRHHARLSILRAPGIYARDRLPLDRLKLGIPSLLTENDAYTNHIHADDLARALLFALARGKGGRSYHASDGRPMKAGDWFDLLADHAGLPRVGRVSRQDAAARIPERRLSFLRESRRLSNRRLIGELRFRFRYPDALAGIA